jgi:hypothetical protein
MRHRFGTTSVIVLALGLGVAMGCKSISASLTSPFDSSSGLSDSISGSFEAVSDGISTSCSGRDATPEEVALGEDVRVLTKSLVASGGARELHVGLGEISAPHGVVDYAAIPSVWHGVGVGLAEAGVASDGLGEWLTLARVNGTDERVHVTEGFEAVVR